MSDTPEDRAREWTIAPETITLPAPTNGVTWAEVYDDEGLAGAVWMADLPQIPRAGIVLAPDRDPSVEFQSDLGLVSLAVRRDPVLDPGEWIAHLAETRDGSGTLTVGETRHSSSFRAMRQAIGWPE